MNSADKDGPGMGRGMGRGPRAAGGSGPGKTGQGVVETRTSGARVEPLFDHERLDVYRVARDCLAMAFGWMDRKMPRDLRDQLERSLVSMLSNIAEGAGKTARADKRRFYEIAKGSTTEAASQFEILKLRSVISAEEYAAIRELLIRVAKMLHGLCGAPRLTREP